MAAAGLPNTKIKDPDGPQAAPSPPFGEPNPLGHDANLPVTKGDHPFLEPSSTAPEMGAKPGDLPVSKPTQVDVPPGWPDPTSELANFDGPPTADVWPAGETRYRVVGDGSRPAGPYWTTEPPISDDVLRNDLAVKNSWNGNHGVVAYTPTEDIPVWTGTVGPQPTSSPHPGGPHHLPGGGQQTYVDDRRFPTGDVKNGDLWVIQSTPWATGSGS